MKENPIAYLSLLHGEKVIVDAEDFPRLLKTSWYLNGKYVYGRIDHKCIALHEYLIGKAPKGIMLTT